MPPPPNLAALLETAIFPGMSARESRILRAWMVHHGAEWDSLDVMPRVGKGVELNPHQFDDKFRADWEKRTRARPDCIGTRVGRALIIEAKEHATNEAIWQVQSYAVLYRAEHPGETVSTCVVCESAHATAVAIATSQGVQLLKYDIPPDEPLAPGTEATT